jgi:hypothetical protein
MHEFDPYQELLNCQHNILELVRGHHQHGAAINGLMSETQHLRQQLAIARIEIAALRTELELLNNHRN